MRGQHLNGDGVSGFVALRVFALGGGFCSHGAGLIPMPVLLRCCRVAGTVALMSMPVMGVDPAYKVGRLAAACEARVGVLCAARRVVCSTHPQPREMCAVGLVPNSARVSCQITPALQGPLEPVYRAALALGTANQLTNILRDVGEDLETRNRIYVPLDELQQVRSCRGHSCRATSLPPARPPLGTVERRTSRFLIGLPPGPSGERARGRGGGARGGGGSKRDGRAQVEG